MSYLAYFLVIFCIFEVFLLVVHSALASKLASGLEFTSCVDLERVAINQIFFVIKIILAAISSSSSDNVTQSVRSSVFFFDCMLTSLLDFGFGSYWCFNWPPNIVKWILLKLTFDVGRLNLKFEFFRGRCSGWNAMLKFEVEV